MIIIITRSYAALWAADLDWIVRPGYSLGRYILGYSQHLASCFWNSAQIYWKCWSFVTQGGFQLTWSVDFLSLTADFNWLEVCFVLSFYFFLDYILLFPCFVALFTKFLLSSFVLLTYLFCTLLYFFFVLFHHLFPFSPILCKFKTYFWKINSWKKNCWQVQIHRSFVLPCA